MTEYYLGGDVVRENYPPKLINRGPSRGQLSTIVDAVYPPAVLPSDKERAGAVFRTRMNLVLSVWDYLRKNTVHSLHGAEIMRLAMLYSEPAALQQGDVVRIFRAVQDEIARTTTEIQGHSRAETQVATPVHADTAARPVTCPFCAKKLPLAALDADYIFPCGCGWGMLRPTIEEFVLDPVTKRDYVWRVASAATSVYHPRRDDALKLWRAVETTKLRKGMRNGAGLIPPQGVDSHAGKPSWADFEDTSNAEFWKMKTPQRSRSGWTPIVWKLDTSIVLWHNGTIYKGPVQQWFAQIACDVQQYGLLENWFWNCTDPREAARQFAAARKPRYTP